MIERGPLPQRGYLVVQNEVVRDENLSFKARGILCFLLSQQPGYSTSADRLSDEGPDGRAAVLSGLKELEMAGYLVRRKERLPNGTFIHKDVVYDAPQRGKPEVENRLVVLPGKTDESAGQARSGLSGVGKPADNYEVPREEVRSEEVPASSSLTLLDDAFCAAPKRTAEQKQNEFETFWVVYPRKTAKEPARAVFERARKKATFETIVEGARRFSDDPNRVDQFTPHATTWLNQARWSDPPLPPRTGTAPSRAQEREGRTAHAIASVFGGPEPQRELGR